MARRPTSDIRVSASDALEFEPEPRRRRGIPTTVWLLLVLILVTAAGLGGFLFGDRLAGLSGDDGGQVPVVHAAEGAIKVRPANPGGQEIPFRDYDINKRMQGEEPTGRVENLLPPPEQVKELPPSPPAETQAPAAAARSSAERASTETLLPAAPAPAPKPVAPKPITAKQVAPPPPAATVVKAPPPQPAAPPPVPSANPGGPMALVPKPQQPAPAAAPVQPVPAAPVTAPVEQAAVPAKSSVSAVEGWQVQLAASRAATAAKAEGERLKQKYADVLGKLTVNVMRADLGAKGVFYRIRLGPAGDKDQARDICAVLSKRGQGCLVIAPGK